MYQSLDIDKHLNCGLYCMWVCVCAKVQVDERGVETYQWNWTPLMSSFLKFIKSEILLHQGIPGKVNISCCRIKICFYLTLIRPSCRIRIMVVGYFWPIFNLTLISFLTIFNWMYASVFTCTHHLSILQILTPLINLLNFDSTY